MATHSNILAWKIPWTEEPGYSPWVCKESGTTEHIHTLIPHHTLIPTYLLGFPHVSVVKNLPAEARDMGSIPGSRRPPWRRKWQLTPVFLPGKSQVQRSLSVYSPWGYKRIRCDLATKNNLIPSVLIVLTSFLLLQDLSTFTLSCFPSPNPEPNPQFL